VKLGEWIDYRPEKSCLHFRLANLPVDNMAELSALASALLYVIQCEWTNRRVAFVFVVEKETQQHLHEAQRVVGPVSMMPLCRRVARTMGVHFYIYTTWLIYNRKIRNLQRQRHLSA